VQQHYGFDGDYANFDAATAACGSGYHAPEAIAYARQNTRPEGLDFSHLDIQLLAALQTVRPRRVLDFGGALGRHYFRLNRMVRADDWRVVELPETAAVGTAEYANGALSFGTRLERADVVVASGALQYVADPYGTMSELAACAPYLIIDRLPIIERDCLTVQRVDPSLFVGAFPAWFLSQERFRTETAGFELMMSWSVPGHRVRVNGVDLEPFKGFLFRTG
jgi:putative methyltransferase (TIGR04325 family)